MNSPYSLVRGGSSLPISPEMIPEGLPWPGSPAAIFPLPGGRGVAASGWVPPQTRPDRPPEKLPLQESTAERRRQVARRRPGHSPVGGPGRADVPLSPLELRGHRSASDDASPSSSLDPQDGPLGLDSDGDPSG